MKFQEFKRQIQKWASRIPSRIKAAVMRRTSYTLVLLYLSLGQLAVPTTAYKITFFDCAQIQHLKTYRLYDVCKPFQQPNGNTTKQYQLLQKRTVQKMTGHGCRVVSTKFTDYCGAYGHVKHVKMPEVAVSRPISPQMYQQIISTGKFINNDGTSHSVNLQTENIIIPKNWVRLNWAITA